MSIYLQDTDLALYGVGSASNAQVVQASALIDAYLQRPEGLIWSPDSQGMPCDMAALSPSLSFTLAGDIAPGSNVVVSLSGPVNALQVGDVLVLDRANPSLKEACVVASTTGPNNALQITLSSVTNAHAAAATADLGLVIEEQKYLPAERPITSVSRAPLLRIVAGVGRYGYARQGEAQNYNMDQFNLLAAVSRFGGPPAWEIFNPLMGGFDIQTGQVWIPAGVMLAYYTEVKLRYVAGFQYSNLPSSVKMACAQLIQALAERPQLGNVKSYKAGDTQITNFAATLLDDDAKTNLNAYRARLFV